MMQLNKCSSVAEKEQIWDSALLSYDDFPRHPVQSRGTADEMHGTDGTTWRKPPSAAVCVIWMQTNLNKSPSPSFWGLSESSDMSAQGWPLARGEENVQIPQL